MCETTWVFFSRLVTLPNIYIYSGNFDMFERQGGLHAKLQVCFRPRHEAEPRTAVETHQLMNSMVKILAHLHPNYSWFDLLLYGKTKFFRLHSEFVQNGWIPKFAMLVSASMENDVALRDFLGLFSDTPEGLSRPFAECSLCARRLLLQRSDSACAQLGLSAIRWGLWRIQRQGTWAP